MALIETESIVLKTYNLAEADKIVVFLSQDQGMIRGVAKGVKRLKSKFGSGLEPFSIVRITYKQKDNIELVGIEKAELVRSFFASASDPEFLERFSYLGDLLITFSPPHDPNETLYRMVRACLDTAAVEPDSLLSVGVYFELWLLRLAGYLPDWKVCSQCKRTPENGEVAKVGSNFYLYCMSCGPAGSSLTADSRLRNLFASAQRLSPTEFVAFSVGDQPRLAELSSLLKRIISQSAGKDVISGVRSMPSHSGLN
jgi:DNA repair protein RecO (recombination protein O)